MPLRGGLYLRLSGNPATTEVRKPGLPTHRTMTVGGVKKRMPVAHFRKAAISAGVWYHPLTGETFEVTRAGMDRWVKKFHAQKRRGIEIPTPVDHSDAADDNRGYVIDAERKGNTLYVTTQAVGSKAIHTAARNRCSVYIDDLVDAKGRNWGESIVHCAYTPKPVIHGHGEFVPVAASRVGGRSRKIPVFYPKKENDMALSAKQKVQVKKMLGLKPNDPLKFVGPTAELAELVLTQSSELAKLAGKKTGKKVKGKPARQHRRHEEDEDLEVMDEDDGPEEDAEDEEEDEEDEPEDSADDDADEEQDDEEEDEDEEDEEEEAPTGKSRTNGQAVARRLSRVIDPNTQVLLSRAIATERKALQDRRVLDPRTEERLAQLFMPEGRLTGLALSRVGKRQTPLYFRVLSILQRAKTIPAGNGRTGSQTLTRTDVPNRSTALDGTTASKAELDKEATETRKWARARQRGHKKGRLTDDEENDE